MMKADNQSKIGDFRCRSCGTGNAVGESHVVSRSFCGGRTLMTWYRICDFCQRPITDLRNAGPG